MNKEEAKRILQRNHYCPTHGTPMKENKQSGFGWGSDYVYYTCPRCDQDIKAAQAAEVREALKTLGLPYPAQIINKDYYE